ncbi:hypothetical protein [Clostridium sp. C8]|uniref:hypothetical protein n=1 Tax=Clostridium sp. C8 TaxID=1667357 RepID=UPI00062E5F22|nr:hypothetical protein [Clostridium sp. C8]KLE16819.1 hypothetical protein AAT22_04315 [Clostridium sp. C8]
MGKSYYRKKSSSWGKTFQDGFKDICEGISKNISKGVPFFRNCCNPAARLCIFILILLTLLLSGIGFYSWVILIMLVIILQFV